MMPCYNCYIDQLRDAYKFYHDEFQKTKDSKLIRSWIGMPKELAWNCAKKELDLVHE